MSAVIYKTQEELDAALAIWQKRLRLQDWHIAAFLKPSRSMYQSGTNGICHRWSTVKEAHIEISDDIQSSSNWPTGVEPDHECILVHELLHLHHDMISFEKDKDETKWTLWEQAIDQTAKIIVEAYRHAA